MKLFIISLPTQKTTLQYLTTACEQRSIPYEVLDPNTINPYDVAISPGDAVYRVSIAAHTECLGLEYQLMQPGTISFYKNDNPLLINVEDYDSFLLQQLGVPVPKTANYIPKDRKALQATVEVLGGFPLIIKALGGSHGVGVMRVDTYESLYSVGDFLNATGKQFVLKQYINVQSSARLIVLGDKVIDSIEYRSNPNDFRSNEGKEPNVSPKTFDVSVQEIAVHAVKALGLEFGGVDIMLSNKGAFVAEVNLPCFFARCQMLTKTDISGMMVEYLAEKSKRRMANTRK